MKLLLALIILFGAFLIGFEVAAAPKDKRDRLISSRTETDYTSCSERQCRRSGWGKNRRTRCRNESGRKKRTVTVNTYEHYATLKRYEDRNYGSWGSCQ